MKYDLFKSNAGSSTPPLVLFGGIGVDDRRYFGDFPDQLKDEGIDTIIAYHPGTSRGFRRGLYLDSVDDEFLVEVSSKLRCEGYEKFVPMGHSHSSKLVTRMGSPSFLKSLNVKNMVLPGIVSAPVTNLSDVLDRDLGVQRKVLGILNAYKTFEVVKKLDSRLEGSPADYAWEAYNFLSSFVPGLYPLSSELAHSGLSDDGAAIGTQSMVNPISIRNIFDYDGMESAIEISKEEGFTAPSGIITKEDQIMSVGLQRKIFENLGSDNVLELDAGHNFFTSSKACKAAVQFVLEHYKKLDLN